MSHIKLETGAAGGTDLAGGPETRTIYNHGAYGPLGEPYAQSGS